MAEPVAAAPEPRVSALLPADFKGESWYSLHELKLLFARQRSILLGIPATLLAICLAYCLFGPRIYEARARIALRGAPSSALDVTPDPLQRGLGTSDTQLETLANVLRSDQVAWRVISSEKLYQQPSFARGFAKRFPAFRADAPAAEARTWLLERFQNALNVQTLPRTTIVQIRFQSDNPVVAANAVNALIRSYVKHETDAQIAATANAVGWLGGQLAQLKTKVQIDNDRLIEFQKKNGLVDTPDPSANGQKIDLEHNPVLIEIDELGKELVAARSERILRETQYQAALHVGPEAVIASDPSLHSQNAGFATAVLTQLHTRRSELEQEESQLKTEHGPNFPRRVEIQAQMADLDRQMTTEHQRLIELFHGAWQTAAEREQLVDRSLQQSTQRGVDLNSAATTYAMMRGEASRSQELYLSVQAKAEEAGLTAGLQSSNIEVVDWARQPLRPVRPFWPIDFAITLFAGAWIAIGYAFLRESLSARAPAATLLVCTLSAAVLHAQAPTPSTSGLPAGVAHLPQSHETRSVPNPAAAPVAWEGTENAAANAATGSTPMAAPIGPGDVMDISEFHTPEFRTHARVSVAGTVVLPFIGEIALTGKDEAAAARSIEAELISKGILLHPQVSLFVTSFAGQDVTILGEVMRPGVYPYAVHHQLLDIVSAAAGFTPTTGRLVTITHRNSGAAAQAIVLDGGGGTQNPELLPGDTVEVQRAGLVYVIGDVMRPGGFPVDPRQKLTVMQALTLAWGPTQNAALTKALLIREQNDGRTVTTLNLKRLLHGQDPDLPVQDRDILFVPNSAAKNLWNRTAESVVQSAAGVSIYAGMVYSQRF
ncbi:MAG: SLBB domain-containing protein [Terracidiphilus sp.]|nr:SLBB domain-containing protein [Terracidiphilus sp.]